MTSWGKVGGRIKPFYLLPLAARLETATLAQPRAPAAHACAPRPSDIRPDSRPREPRDGMALPPTRDWWRKPGPRRGSRWAVQSHVPPGCKCTWCRRGSCATPARRGAEKRWLARPLADPGWAGAREGVRGFALPIPASRCGRDESRRAGIPCAAQLLAERHLCRDKLR